MVNFDTEMVHSVLIKHVRIVVMIRRLAKDIGKDVPELAQMEREVRAAASEVRRARDILRAKGMGSGGGGDSAEH